MPFNLSPSRGFDTSARARFTNKACRINKVIEYRVGLARNNAQGRWDVERWSDALQVGFTMNPGDTRQLPSATALIPIDNLPSLKDTWLVVQVKVQREGTVGTTYAHSQKLALD